MSERMATLYQIYLKWFPIALPPAGTFDGQTAVVTGGTSGLGLAAAAHLINLGAAEVVISSRDPSRADDALASLEKATKGRSRGRVRVLALDMERYDSVVRLADEVKKMRRGEGGVDVVILNAGLIGTEHRLTEEGWYVCPVHLCHHSLLLFLLFYASPSVEDQGNQD
jgi:NADPH:quinone reductase-like Zn-dependent oxidoreductase